MLISEIIIFHFDLNYLFYYQKKDSHLFLLKLQRKGCEKLLISYKFFAVSKTIG